MPGATCVREVELDAEREAAAAKVQQVSHSARATPTDAAPVLPQISGAQSAR